MKKRHEQSGPDDRPDDRKRLAAYAEHERLGQVELLRDHDRARRYATDVRLCTRWWIAPFVNMLRIRRAA